MQCEVVMDSYRRVFSSTPRPVRLHTGEVVEVTLPLEEIEDWEQFLRPVDPRDVPAGATLEPVEPKHSEVSDSDMVEDQRREALVIEAVASIDPGGRRGWTPQGTPAMSAVREHIESKGEDASWVTGAIIKTFAPNARPDWA